MPIVDYVPDDTEAFLKWAPHAQTKRVYGRILYTNDTATTVPPSVQLSGFPVYNATDEAHIFSRPYDATLVSPNGTGPGAGIWYVDVPIYDDADNYPEDVYVTVSHPDWPTEETRRVLSAYGAKVPWINCQLVVPLPVIDATPRQWIGAATVVILGAHENPPAVPVTGVLYARLAEGAS